MSASHERVRDALELREPDRVPTFDIMLEFSTDTEILGKKPSPLGPIIAKPRVSDLLDKVLPHVNTAFVLDKVLEQLTDLGAEAAVKMGYDSAWLPYFPALRLDDSRTITDIFGRVNDFAMDEKGNMGNPIYRTGLITSPAAWDAWDKKPIFRLPEKVNKVFGRIQSQYGDRLFIFGFCNYGLFESIWQPMGFERFVIAIRKERSLVDRMVRFYTDLFCVLLEAQADAGIPGAIYTDDLCYRSGPMLNPRMIEELFGDSYRRVTETAHALGMKIVIHSCGNTESLLERFADWGFDAVHPLEPTAGMELSRAKELIGDRMCLIGNIDVSHVLVDASREEVFEAVRHAIHDAGPGGGYILGPDHSHPAISVERLRWMVEAGREYGRYPLSV
ncbi:MAG TPA: uroporphyrinogen decarboxylase family protein [Candidatus Anoxymicrobiaceae bacterium]